jgi:hypothetical protein
MPNTTKLLPEVDTRTRTKTVRWLNRDTGKAVDLMSMQNACSFIKATAASPAGTIGSA